MRCSTAQKWIELYIDDELRAEQSLLLAKHVRECCLCADVLRVTQRVSGLPFDVEMPENLRGRVSNTVNTIESFGPTIRVQSRPQVGRRAISWGLAASLTVVATIAMTLAPHSSTAEQLWRKAFTAMEAIRSVKGETVYLDKDGFKKSSVWYFSGAPQMDFSTGKVWVDQDRGTWEWYPEAKDRAATASLTEIPFEWGPDGLGKTESVTVEDRGGKRFYRIVVDVTNKELLAHHGVKVRSVNYLNEKTYLPEKVQLQKFEGGEWVQFGMTTYQYNVPDPFRS